MVDVRTSSARSRNGICGFCGIKSFVNLTYLCTTNIQFQIIRQVCVKRILTGLYVLQSLHNLVGLLCKLVVCGIDGNGYDLLEARA